MNPSKMITILVAVIVLTLSPASGAPRINGGNDAPAGLFPYYVSLQVQIQEEFYHACGGAIVSSVWVLSAAHCIKGDLEIKRIVAGLNNLSVQDDPNMQIREIEWYAINPNYTGHINDFVLIKVKQNFDMTEYVKTIEISKVPCVSREPVTFMGFGINTIEEPSDQLQMAQMDLITSDACQSLLNPLLGDDNDFSKEMHICTAQTPGPCLLDDGGPLVQDNRLIGVLSWIPTTCSSQSVPAMYTRIGQFYDFIQIFIQNFST